MSLSNSFSFIWWTSTRLRCFSSQSVVMPLLWSNCSPFICCSISSLFLGCFASLLDMHFQLVCLHRMFQGKILLSSCGELPWSPLQEAPCCHSQSCCITPCSPLITPHKCIFRPLNNSLCFDPDPSNSPVCYRHTSNSTSKCNIWFVIGVSCGDIARQWYIPAGR